MDTAVTHHIDASEPDAQGMYEYYYEYDVYTFTEAGVVLVARSYSDENEAHFLRIEVDGESRLMTQADLQRPLVAKAAGYLRRLGMTQIDWLSGRGNGYEPLPAVDLTS